MVLEKTWESQEYTTTPIWSNHNLDQSGSIDIEAKPSTSKKDYRSLEAQMIVNIF